MFILKNSTTKEIYATTATKEPLDYVKLRVDTIIEETNENIVYHNGKKYLESEVPAYTEEELTKKYTILIQAILDKTAYSYGYTGIDEGVPGACNSVCTYGDTGVQKFDDEGRAFKKWRSAVWKKALEILSLVKSGEIGIPSEEDLIEMLPKLEIIYTN